MVENQKTQKNFQKRQFLMIFIHCEFYCDCNAALRKQWFFKILSFFLQKMTSWMTHDSFDEADEDEAASEVAEQIKAVDLELQQLQFEMQVNAKQDEIQPKREESVPNTSTAAQR